MMAVNETKSMLPFPRFVWKLPWFFVFVQ